MVQPVQQVLLDARAPLQVAQALERTPAPTAAAVVDLDHQVTAVGQELRVGIVEPVVADPVRAAMRQHHDGKAATVAVARDREHRLQFDPVAGLEAHRAPLGHQCRVDPVARRQHLLQLVRGALQHVPAAGVAVAGDVHQHHLAIAADIDEGHVLLRQQSRQCPVQLGLGAARVEVDQPRTTALRRGGERYRWMAGPLRQADARKAIANEHLRVAPIQVAQHQLRRPVGMAERAIHPGVVRRERHGRPDASGLRRCQRLPAPAIIGPVQQMGVVIIAPPCIARDAVAVDHELQLRHVDVGDELERRALRIDHVEHGRGRVALELAHVEAAIVALGHALDVAEAAIQAGRGVLLLVAVDVALVLAIEITGDDLAGGQRLLQRAVLAALGHHQAPVTYPHDLERAFVARQAQYRHPLHVRQAQHLHGVVALAEIGRERQVVAGRRQPRHRERAGLGECLHRQCLGLCRRHPRHARQRPCQQQHEPAPSPSHDNTPEAT